MYCVPEAIERGTVAVPPLKFTTENLINPAVEEAEAPVITQPPDKLADSGVLEAVTSTVSPTRTPVTAQSNARVLEAANVPPVPMRLQEPFNNCVNGVPS